MENVKELIVDENLNSVTEDVANDLVETKIDWAKVGKDALVGGLVAGGLYVGYRLVKKYVKPMILKKKAKKYEEEAEQCDCCSAECGDK